MTDVQKILVFVAVAIVAYLVGNFNVAKILAWNRHRKDITKLGSGNPGTMNMMRSFGFGAALGTVLLEFAKTGLICFLSGLIFREQGLYYFAYFFAGAFVVLGSVFPILFDLKGGKGVACLAGMFMFTPLWYIGIILFFVGIATLVVVDYAFIPTLGFCLLMTIGLTVYFSVYQVAYFWAIIVIMWLLLALTFYKHKGNFKRLFNHEEKKMGFRNILKKFFKKQPGVQEINEEDVDSPPEKEIIIDENDEQK